jgi:acetylornithine deacetylase
MRRFVAEKRAFRLAVVAEPTRARAVVAHRGVATGVMSFEGRASHSSDLNAQSAVHDLARWAGSALDLARELESIESGGLRGVRLNIGRIEGGEKPNVVAARAEARFGVRPPPCMSGVDALARFAALAPARFEMRFSGPPLPASEDLGARAAAEVARLGLSASPPVDFWTEAALLSEAGTPAIVLGPGDIVQAHGPDEFVALAELETAARAYLSILEAG